jgi:hypothetical protein
LATDFFLSVKVNDVQNQGAYVLSTEYRTSEQITAFDILTGEIDVVHLSQFARNIWL